MKKLYSLGKCLSDAYCGGVCNPQDNRFMWAILEGLRRVNVWAPPWRSVQAYKNHKCVRNCTIADGDTYFIEDVGRPVNYPGLPKFCAGCMAMILYFKKVYDLPPISYTHWDMEKKAPVKIDEEGPKKR
jgi:hypothetical protein